MYFVIYGRVSFVVVFDDDVFARIVSPLTSHMTFILLFLILVIF